MFGKAVVCLAAAALFFGACMTAVPWTVRAQTAEPGSRGQSVYVPAYSHIYSGNRENPFYLAVTLSIRNMDPAGSITLVSAVYYDSDGKPIRNYVDKPVVLGPLSSTRYVVKESDKTGGSGASFVVKWMSDGPVNPPVMESIMIGTSAGQGISFVSRGVPMKEIP